ncbi:MAG: sigma-70 family RNA polymerase sigma factor, partial [Lachnospiraceae bacterium]|nr:sigma-70 family RNA polymerase sigma factor [Lachnospiraceae bacterium]
YWDRNERAIQETDRKYGSYCHTIAYNILENKEDSEECVNDTWLRAWNTMPPQRPNYLRLFLGKITRNLSLDIWKGKQAQKRGGGELSLALDELSECVADTKDVEDALQAKELQETIERFLHTLPKRERELFLQRYFYMRSAKELAAHYGMKENHVAVLLSRTRKKLAAQLVKEGWSV